MSLEERIAEQVARLPAQLRSLLDAELAAGNTLVDVELRRGPDRGKVALVLKRPFHDGTKSAPKGIKYRESERKFGRIFELVTMDDRFSLLTVGFKEIVLQPITGPKAPTTDSAALNQQREKEEAARIDERKRLSEAEATSPLLAAFLRRHGEPSAAAKKFLASLQLTYDQWHDGDGYDLEALGEVSESECAVIEQILIDHQPRDWRDIEALALFDSGEARQAIAAALNHSDPKVRREAKRHLPQKQDLAKRKALLIQTLNTRGLYDGLSEAIDEAAEFHPPAVIDALLKGALKRDGEAVH
jgi:hypothetical protein